jgi:C1A family cysteine protease
MKTRKTSAKQRVLNCVPSRNVERDWNIAHAKGAGVLALRPPVPARKDLREPWWTIANQQDTGSCVGWASTDSVIRWHFVKAGRLNKDELLSVRFIWMSAKETDEFTNEPTTFIEEQGTSLKAALDIARKYGIVRDAVLPFWTNQLFKGDTQTFYATASQLKIANYFNLGVDLNAWKEWLANHGPILTRLDVDDTWDKAKETAGKLDAYLPDTARGGHAVAFVGYTPDRFIVRNSWGTDEWGDKGFAYASYPYAQAAFTEAYGVTV